MSGSLEWSWDIGISDDSQASTNLLMIQACFSCNSIVFSCKSQEVFAKLKG